MKGTSKKVAIIDYGMGNLFSVKRAIEQTGIEGKITASQNEIENADGVILPGVGAFGDAMVALCDRDLVTALQRAAASKPFFGICLGMQLLMSKSCEFGEHAGLNIIEGEVLRLPAGMKDGRRLKVPQIGWNKAGDDYFYFVHSYYVKPKDERVSRTTTRYGSLEFCSSLKKDFVTACQFHPERSGPQGLQFYKNFAKQLQEDL